MHCLGVRAPGSLTLLAGRGRLRVDLTLRRRSRRGRAYLLYLKKPFLKFLPPLVFLLVVLLAGTLAFHALYDRERLNFRQALYITYCLVFMEHVLPFPRHWVLQLFYLLLPPVGFVVILDGIVQFSYHLLRRDESGKEWVQAMAKTLRNHVILCGLGKVGTRVLEQLLRLAEDVAVLEKDPQCPNLAYARNRAVPVLIGNGREQGIFEDLNVKQARSIILATDDDLANLEMALDARKIKPNIRVVMRMYDQELAAKIRESFDLHLAFSTSELAAPLFATSSTDRSILNSFYVDHRLLVVAALNIQPDSELLGKRVGDLRTSHRVLVLSHARNGEVNLYPEAQTFLQTGDRITVQTEPAILRELHRLNGDPEPY